MKPTMEMKSLSDLKDEFRKLGKRIEEQGLPDSLTPFVVGFAGYGNVSRGAQELFDILPHKTIASSELSTLSPDDKVIYKCVFKEEHMVTPIDSSSDFDLQDYYDNGDAKYKGDFHKYVPYLSVLMNCIYWETQYPRLLSRPQLQDLYAGATEPRLKVIGDITCDIDGSLACTVRSTEPDSPVYVYDPSRDRAVDGVAGRGPVVLAVDFLPCELPVDASNHFSRALAPFVGALARDFNGGSSGAHTFLSAEPLMEYRTCRIRETRECGETLRMIVLDGELPAAASSGRRRKTRTSPSTAIGYR